MSYRCERCNKAIPPKIPSALEHQIPDGVKRVCYPCYKPEKNEKYNDWQREKAEEEKKLAEKIESEKT